MKEYKFKINGKEYKCIEKDKWEHDVAGDEYEEVDTWGLGEKLNGGGTFYVGSHKVGSKAAYSKARAAARADWEQYTTPAYLMGWEKNPEQKHYLYRSVDNLSDEQFDSLMNYFEKLKDK